MAAGTDAPDLDGADTIPLDPPSGVAHDIASGYRLLLPPGWVRLPLDSPERSRQIVDRELAHLPRDSSLQLRRAARSMLDQSVTAARSGGAIDAYLFLRPVAGIAAPASLLITPAAKPHGLLAPASMLVTSLSSDGQASVVSIAGSETVRLLRQRESAPGVTTTTLDFFVPLPDSSGHLLLTFSTSMAPLVDALVRLFDAIAETLRWSS